MFSPQIVEGALPSTSTKQLDKGKERVIVEEEDTHETEQEFQLIDLDDDNEERITNMLLKSKDARITELQANLGRAKNVINYLELENQQLETMQAISEFKAIRARKEAGKAKSMLDETLGTFYYNEDEEEQLPRKRLRKIGLKKALAREREKETELAEQLTPSEMLAMEIRYDR